MANKIQTLEQHLDYEAIIQIAEIDDQDLLYLNFDKQALGNSSLVALLVRVLWGLLYLDFSNQALGESSSVTLSLPLRWGQS